MATLWGRMDFAWKNSVNLKFALNFFLENPESLLLQRHSSSCMKRITWLLNTVSIVREYIIENENIKKQTEIFTVLEFYECSLLCNYRNRN